jgi:hypothetical protein
VNTDDVAAQFDLNFVPGDLVRPGIANLAHDSMGKARGIVIGVSADGTVVDVMWTWDSGTRFERCSWVLVEKL